MAIREYQGVRFDAISTEKVGDVLSVEEALQINVNGTPFTITMRSPNNDEALVRGLLHSEGVLKNVQYLPEILLQLEKDGSIITVANVAVPEDQLGDGYSNGRNLLSVSSCGICGKTELDDLAHLGAALALSKTLEAHVIPILFGRMQAAQNSFKQSGGSHAAAAFNAQGELLTIMEDIGRHNAVDKVVGDLILLGKSGEAQTLLVSGRISYEIVIKAFKAKIPILCAVSAPSSLAVDYAKELGLTLLAFCRGERATCYAHPERIQSTYQGQKAV